MKVKTFNIKDEEKVNQFIDTVDLGEKGSVQLADGETFVVFYETEKDKYEEYFSNRMITGLKNNLFHEKLRKMAVDAEVEHFTEKGAKSEEFDQAKKSQEDAQSHIGRFEAKLKALTEWKS